MPQTRAKTTASTHTHDISSSSPAPATNSSPTRATPYTRSKGPAAASAAPINSTSTAQPRVRTPLTIRLPRASVAGHSTTLSITNNASKSSLTASAPAIGINIGAGAPIPTSSIRTPIPAPTSLIRTPPPTSSNVLQSTSTAPLRPPPSAPTPATSAPKSAPVSSAHLPAPPIYTFPPPPPPPNHVADPAAAARTSSTTQLPASVTPNANAAALSALSAQSATLANTSVSTSQRYPTPPPASSHASLSTSTTLRPVQRSLAMASESQIASRPQVQYPTPSSAGALPSPASGVDPGSDYARDAMEVDTEGISAMMNSHNNSTGHKTSDKHREANKKYRQRLKERIKNGEIDELEAQKMKERKRVNARNSRARRKLAMRNEAANGSMSSVEPGPLLGPSIHPSLPPSVDPIPGPGDFMLCLPDTNPPVGSYYSTTFHEILTKADHNSGSSDGASITHPHFEPDSHPNFDFDAAMPPALFPLTKARDFRDACTMTEPSPDLPKESDLSSSLEPIAPALARRPHRQLTPERLHDFATNALQLVNKAFLLIVPDPSSTLGKLVLCKVLEYRVSSTGHRFLVQFWGDKKASEMDVNRMMEVLEGGYEIDPPSAGPSAGLQGVGLAGRVFGALRSFTGF
ncbi:hypothetical protein F4604DRAFT_1247413 [Suillus subluteus]|nr:hypothetical protein F4604DRAFT_1247413 [Suillus subluteus]